MLFIQFFVALLVVIIAFVAADPTVTDLVFLDVEIDGMQFGRVLIGLFGSSDGSEGAVPLAVENFKSLAKGTTDATGQSLGYAGKKFFYVDSNGIIGGDVTNDNGSGGASIYGASFEKEVSTLTNNAAGQVSFLAKDDGTISSIFQISTAAIPDLDGSNLIIGKVIEGSDLINLIQQFVPSDASGAPIDKTIKLTASGVVH